MKRYSAERKQSLGEPDLFRMHYLPLVAEIVAAIVRGVTDKKDATVFIRQRAVD